MAQLTQLKLEATWKRTEDQIVEIAPTVPSSLWMGPSGTSGGSSQVPHSDTKPDQRR